MDHGCSRYRPPRRTQPRPRSTSHRVPAPRARHRARRARRRRPVQPRRPRGRSAVLLGPDPAGPRHGRDRRRHAAEQATRCLQNLQAVCAAAGASLRRRGALHGLPDRSRGRVRGGQRGLRGVLRRPTRRRGSRSAWPRCRRARRSRSTRSCRCRADGISAQVASPTWRMTLRMTPDEQRALRARAEREGRSMKEVAPDAERQYVGRQEQRELLDEVLDEAVAALRRGARAPRRMNFLDLEGLQPRRGADPAGCRPSCATTALLETRARDRQQATVDGEEVDRIAGRRHLRRRASSSCTRSARNTRSIAAQQAVWTARR